MPGTPLHAGASIEVVAPDFLGGRGTIVEDGRYRFVLSVRLDDAADWDRHAAAFGATPLGAADEPGFAVADVIDLSLELTGAEILTAQALAPTPSTSTTDAPR